MKIAGVVNNYNEALDIEEIVKVFIIEKQIFKLQPLDGKKNFENLNNHNNNIISANDIKYSETYNKKFFEIKNNIDNKPVFNVRGFV